MLHHNGHSGRKQFQLYGGTVSLPAQCSCLAAIHGSRLARAALLIIMLHHNGHSGRKQFPLYGGTVSLPAQCSCLAAIHGSRLARVSPAYCPMTAGLGSITPRGDKWYL
ncbi:uncharacterized protein ACBT44_009040 [Syngnathus typhle]